ncbi:hypothetical protein C5C27_06305 [Rathayibacter sp. AY2B7]|uniref:hypothetical protein n=1 Tax=Rathayibacter sp. AY2B7 TaxID=2080571 RepID=UPI000CE73141|nr:hypothetical protein [Rathayibacter sp. AY2B7]PPG63071.1 hypothetical protein C5C27_06305 [Rathayibacter sp. AY2B7]
MGKPTAISGSEEAGIVRSARRRHGVTIITTAALLGALAFPSVALATEVVPDAASSPAPAEPAPTAEPTATSEPTATPEPTPTPAPTPAPTIAPVESAQSPLAIALDRTTYEAGSAFSAIPSAEGWAGGLDVSGTGFQPGTVAVVVLRDGDSEEAVTTSVITASGELRLQDWLPADADGVAVDPHLPLPGETISVVAEGLDASGATVASDAVELTVTQPDTSVVFQNREDGGVLPAGADIQVGEFRIYGVVASFRGFDRGEDVSVTLTAPDGSTSALVPPAPTPLSGEAFVLLDADTMADQLGTFTVTATGETSGRSVTSSLEQVPSRTAIRIWPQGASPEPAPADGQPTSGGALLGFGADETVSIGVFSTSGARQTLTGGGSSLEVGVDALGWSLISLGQYPLQDPASEIYCVIARGTSSGLVASTSYDYTLTEEDPIAGEADCSAAVAAVTAHPAGAGPAVHPAGSGPAAQTGGHRPVLASTGVSTTAPLALAAFGVLGGLALTVLRRRRA